MRRAIISDIHANWVALQAVLADIATQHVDNTVCLGDVCGYGPDPVECVDLVRASCQWVLCGNHDLALFLSVPIGFNKFARAAIEWQRGILAPHWYSFSKKVNRWHWLESLPPSILEEGALYVHASPRDPLMEYVEESDFADMGFGPSTKAQEIFEKFERLAFCGHSHRPGIASDEFHWIKPTDLPEQLYPLPSQGKTLVNVGSVGQPRDGNPASCYVIYDTDQKTITFRRVAYDIQAELARFKRVPQLSERLSRRLETGQ